MLDSNPAEKMPPLASEKVMIDRKIFFLDLKENQRGRFLKITEDVGGRRDTILLPATAFREFAAAFVRLVQMERTLPSEENDLPPDSNHFETAQNGL
jgi:hypothetical protein